MKIQKDFRIIWLSANLFGYELLKEALKIYPHSIVAIVTLDETAKTRMYDGVNVSNWTRFDIPIYKINNINDHQKLIKQLHPDVIFMCGWRQILNPEILEIPKKGVIAFHPTLLPKGRGSAPIINTILEGNKKSGVTMFYACDGVDNGDIIGQEEFVVNHIDDAKDIYLKVIKSGKRLIKKYLPLLIQEKAPRISQKEDEATYFPKRNIKDNEIFLNDSPDQTYLKIKAFTWPYNGAFVKLGKKKLIIWKGELINE